MSDYTPHDGNGMPVDRNTIVSVKLRNGKERHGNRAEYWDWWWTGHPADVVGYSPTPPKGPA